MKQITEAEALAEMRRHTTANRAEVEASKRAQCISCLDAFAAKTVTDWHDEWTAPEKQNRVKRWTAKCPSCGKPTVVGDASGILSQHYAVVRQQLLAEQKPRRR